MTEVHKLVVVASRKMLLQRIEDHRRYRPGVHVFCVRASMLPLFECNLEYFSVLSCKVENQKRRACHPKMCICPRSCGTVARSRRPVRSPEGERRLGWVEIGIATEQRACLGPFRGPFSKNITGVYSYGLFETDGMTMVDKPVQRGCINCLCLSSKVSRLPPESPSDQRQIFPIPALRSRRILSVLGKGLTVHVDGPYGMPVEVTNKCRRGGREKEEKGKGNVCSQNESPLAGRTLLLAGLSR